MKRESTPPPVEASFEASTKDTSSIESSSGDVSNIELTYTDEGLFADDDTMPCKLYLMVVCLMYRLLRKRQV